jgi:hypothetical protein
MTTNYIVGFIQAIANTIDEVIIFEETVLGIYT